VQAAAAPPAEHALGPNSTVQPAELRQLSSPAAKPPQPLASDCSRDSHPVAHSMQHTNGSSSAPEAFASGGRFDGEVVARHWGEAWTLRRLDDGRRLVSQPAGTQLRHHLHRFLVRLHSTTVMVMPPPLLDIMTLREAGIYMRVWWPLQVDGQVAGRLLNAMTNPGRKGSTPAFAGGDSDGFLCQQQQVCFHNSVVRVLLPLMPSHLLLQSDLYGRPGASQKTHALCATSWQVQVQCLLLLARSLSGSASVVCLNPNLGWPARAEGLARQLRLCGIDAASVPVDPHTQPRHRIYRCGRLTLCHGSILRA
jgi:hypothetical protein